MTSVSTRAPESLRKVVLALALAGFSAAALSACNTVDGAGKDIESTGEAIQDGADD
jgi:predicted small secreted protein